MLQETYLKAIVPINMSPYFLKTPKLSALSQAKCKHFNMSYRQPCCGWHLRLRKSVTQPYDQPSDAFTALCKCANVEHFATYRVKSSHSRLEWAFKSFPIPEQLFLVFEWLLVVAIQCAIYWRILAPAGCQVIIRPNLNVLLSRTAGKMWVGTWAVLN